MIGLTDQGAQKKFRIHGENTLTGGGNVPWYIFFLKEQTGFFPLLLWLCAVLYFIAHNMSTYDYKYCLELDEVAKCPNEPTQTCPILP